MKKFSQNRKRFTVVDISHLLDVLPKQVYTIYENINGCYLEAQEPILIPEKVYSNDQPFIKHVLKSWNLLDSGNLGVALVGGKGLGKSFTSNVLITEVDLPILKIDSVMNVNSIVDLLQEIQTDYVLFIDEFDKLFYAPEADDKENNKKMPQERLLNFLDNGGQRKNKIFFVITSNESYKISKYLKNRPTRLRYFKNYEFLHPDIIREIVDDLLIDEKFKDDLLENIPAKDINIDALIKIINEVNTHGVPYSSFKEFFNFIGEEIMMVSCSIEHKGIVYNVNDNVKLTSLTATRQSSFFLGYFGENNASQVRIKTPIKDFEKNQDVMIVDGRVDLIGNDLSEGEEPEEENDFFTRDAKIKFTKKDLSIRAKYKYNYGTLESIM